jgi:hypothetical protein
MENEGVYGEVLCEISPKVMIDKGEIVTPKLITMMLDNDTPRGVVAENNQHMLVKTVIEAFKKNQEQVKEKSYNPSAIGTKLLVSFLGTDELVLVQDSEEFKTWCQANHVRVVSLSSREGSYMDFEEKARNKVYDDMKGLRDEEDCILLQIDILAEGINLPSITGVLPLRHLNEIKLFQTFGRALRLMKADREKLYSGEITPADKSKWIKPYAYLILPLHIKQMDVSSEDMKATIQRILDTYGIPIEEFLPAEGFKARDIKSLDIVTHHKKISKTQKDFPLLTVVEEFILNSFMHDLPTDPQERYEALMEMFNDYGEGESDA